MAGETDLDFWVGEWDCIFGEGVWASNRITKTLGGRVILEDFRSKSISGMSTSVYNLRSGRWQQTWVDDQGGYLVFEGGRVGERFVLDQDAERSSSEERARMVWSEITPDAFVWDYQKQGQSGEWKSAWLIRYTRRASSRVA